MSTLIIKNGRVISDGGERDRSDVLIEDGAVAVAFVGGHLAGRARGDVRAHAPLQPAAHLPGLPSADLGGAPVWFPWNRPDDTRCGDPGQPSGGVVEHDEVSGVRLPLSTELPLITVGEQTRAAGPRMLRDRERVGDRAAADQPGTDTMASASTATADSATDAGLTWGPPPPGLPTGARVAVISGDPGTDACIADATDKKGTCEE